MQKKGSATFGLRKTDHVSESAPDPAFLTDVTSNNSREYKIILDSVPTAGLELWTCIRKWMPGSPWWVLDPSFLSQVSQGSASLDPFYATTEFNDGTDFGPLAYVPPLISPANPDDGVPIFRQFNSAYDFNCPEKFVQRNLTPNYVEGSFTSYQRTDNGDNTDFWQYTASFIGYVASLNSVSSAEGSTNYFISSPLPKPPAEEPKAMSQGGIVQRYGWRRWSRRFAPWRQALLATLNLPSSSLRGPPKILKISLS